MQTYDLLHCMSWVQRMAETFQFIKLWTHYRLEVTIVKREQGLMWQELVKGDTKGKEVLDPALIEEMHLRLAHLCSDREVCDWHCPPWQTLKYHFTKEIPNSICKHMTSSTWYCSLSRSNNKHARIIVSIRVNLWKILFCYERHELKYCFL